MPLNSDAQSSLRLYPTCCSFPKLDNRLIERIDHPVVQDTAIFVGSRERRQISTAKKNIPQLLK
jgi:hypothetical protein